MSHSAVQFLVIWTINVKRVYVYENLELFGNLITGTGKSYICLFTLTIEITNNLNN
jgi:hypothetical protein